MSEHRQLVTDDGALHNYRTEIPNTIIRGIMGSGLTLPARWLYVYLKSIAGDCGECWQNMTTLAAGSRLSRGAVSNARKELIEAKLIVMTKGKGALHETDRIRILDIWDQNMAEFRREPSSPHERGPSSPHEHAATTEASYSTQTNEPRVHHMNTPSSLDERASSPHEHPSSLSEPKKISLKKIPEKNEDTPPTPSQVERKRSRTKASQQPNTDFTPSFNKFWALYPRKEKKVGAFAIWCVRELDARAAEIAEKVARLKNTLWRHKEVQYIPLPTTWLNEAGYEDDLVPLDDMTPNGMQPAPRSLSYAEQRRQREAERDRAFLGDAYESTEGPTSLSDRDDPVIDGVEYRRVDD
jgi:hypothetical protein